MGEYIDIVDAWLKSKPSAMKNEELYVLIRTMIKAIREYWDELKEDQAKDRTPANRDNRVRGFGNRQREQASSP